MINPKIFLVDDDEFYLNIMMQYIRNAGYENVVTFKTGTECLNRIQEKPDIIFLDHNMDNLSGFEVLRKIKRYDPNLYVVMISAQDEIKPAVDCLKHGAFDYIQKGENDHNKIANVLKRIQELDNSFRKASSNPLKKLLLSFLS
jgi:DNA-binding NtrC family response regulator